MTGNAENSRNGKIRVAVDEDLLELIPGYLENRRHDIGEINNALVQDDFETIRSLGHKMKGSGGGYGFDAISDIGRALENAAKDRRAQEIRDQLERLQYFLDNLELI